MKLASENLMKMRQEQIEIVEDLSSILRDLFDSFRKKVIFVSRNKYFPGNYESFKPWKEPLLEYEKSPKSPVGVSGFNIHSFVLALMPSSEYLIDNAAACFMEIADAFIRGYGLYHIKKISSLDCVSVFGDDYPKFLSFALGVSCPASWLEKEGNAFGIAQDIISDNGILPQPSCIKAFLEGHREKANISGRDAFRKIHKEQLLLSANLNYKDMHLASSFYVGSSRIFNFEMPLENYANGKALECLDEIDRIL